MRHESDMSKCSYSHFCIFFLTIKVPALMQLFSSMNANHFSKEYSTMIQLLFTLFTFTSVKAVITTLPELNTIKEYAFRYPYSCQPSPSYKYSALFLTDYGVSRNMPDILYNGACGSQDYFEVMFSGDDFGLITDLGDVSFENVTASKAFNYQDVFGMSNRFTQTANVVSGHTYAILLAKSEIRALFLVRVDNYQPNRVAAIRYAVKQYGIIDSVQEAPGFSWNEPNH